MPNGLNMGDGRTVCPECLAVVPAGAGRCPRCDYPMVVAPAAGAPSAPVDWARKPDGGPAPDGPTQTLPPASTQPLPPVAGHPPSGPHTGYPPRDDRFWEPAPSDRGPLSGGPAGQYGGGPAGQYGGGPAGQYGSGPRPMGGGSLCPHCGQANAPERTLCERCGTRLRYQPVEPDPRPYYEEWPPPAERRPSRALLAALLAVLGFVVVVFIAALALRGGLGSLGGDDDPATSAQPTNPNSEPAISSPTREAAPVTLPASRVSVEASSVLKPGSGAYEPENMLDGKIGTAWNSDGEKIGRGVGVTLTFTFDQPVDLRGITVRNGYLKSKVSATVYRDNGRLRAVEVKTDEVTREWALEDTPDHQTLSGDLGMTQQVELEVLDIYPGAKYKDLALTEIRFSVAP